MRAGLGLALCGGAKAVRAVARGGLRGSHDYVGIVVGAVYEPLALIWHTTAALR
jgi:hypothetical protein